jgi:hypothetical protein
MCFGTNVNGILRWLFQVDFTVERVKGCNDGDASLLSRYFIPLLVSKVQAAVRCLRKTPAALAESAVGYRRRDLRSRYLTLAACPGILPYCSCEINSTAYTVVLLASLSE